MIVSAIALAIAAFASPAGERRDIDSSEYRDYLTAYATCMVRENHDRVGKAIASDLDANTLEQRFDDIFVTRPVAFVANCRELVIRDGVGIPLRGDGLRMALAEALVKADLHGDTIASFADRAPLNWWDGPQTRVQFDKELAKASSDGGRKRIQDRYVQRVAQGMVWRFGECVVRREPVRARDWLLAKTGTAEEATARSALAPAFGSCVVKGQKASFNQDAVRGSVAVSYYRLAKARPAISGVTH